MNFQIKIIHVYCISIDENFGKPILTANPNDEFYREKNMLSNLFSKYNIFLEIPFLQKSNSGRLFQKRKFS